MADVISFGPEEPERPDRPRRVPQWVMPAGVIVVVAAVVGGLVLVHLHGRPEEGRTGAAAPTTTAPPAGIGPACLPMGWGQQPLVPASIAGLRIDGTQVRAGLDRCDRTAGDGAWTVVVRRADGSFGRRGAVVTFPAEPSAGGRRVVVGGVTGTVQAGSVTWPVAGRHARVRGDLGEAGLVAVAAATRVEAGRPVVEAPAGLVVVTAGPYRSPTVHETRYGSTSVGEGGALGDGLTFTRLASGGGYEDQVYALTARDGPPVHGRPTVVSEVFGGNGGIAWEPAPGLVAVVGYSGSLLDDVSAAALHRLALRIRPMTAEQWREAGATVLDQTNAPG